MQHDGARQIGYIQQALSQNKRPTGFLIGAGCPLSIRNAAGEPLIPDVAGLTEIINKNINDGPNAENWKMVLSAIIEDGEESNNIEFILSYVRQLLSVAGKSSARGLSKDALKALDKDICAIISNQVDKALPNKNSPYHDLATWARSIRRENPVHIFTTNYDLLLEQSLEESSAPYFDGFVGSRKAFFDLGAIEDEATLPARWSRLWKIHGSLNWRLDESGKRVIRSEKQSDNESYLIYPSHLKYDQSRKMPYIAMLDRLKDFLLKQQATLFISGYSFSDEHINDVICRSLEANPSAHVFAFIYGNLEDEKYKNARECGNSLPNLSILAGDRAIIGRIEESWKEIDETSSALPPGSLVKEAEGNTTFGLGNFAVFGRLVRHLTGGITEEIHV